MLQLSNLELDNFVDAEIQQNPLLEKREWAAKKRFPPVVLPNKPRPRLFPRVWSTISLPTRPSTGTPPREPKETDRFDLAEEPQAWRSRSGALGGDDRPGVEQTAARPRTLARARVGADRNRSSRPGRSADRAAPARSARRERLSRRIARRHRDAPRLRSVAGRGGAARGFSNSIRPGFSLAICPNASASSCATAIGSTRRCRRCSTTCRCSPRATSRR